VGVLECRERRSVHHGWNVRDGCLLGSCQRRLLIREAFGIVELESELVELLAIR
jgi:hypothetical protein